MTSKSVFFAVSAFLIIAGCSYITGPEKELEALNTAKDEVLTQWAKIIDKGATRESISEARKVLESKKVDLNAKRDALNAAPKGMKGDWLTTWLNTKATDERLISEMSMKFDSYDEAQEFRKLGDEFIEAAYGK